MKWLFRALRGLLAALFVFLASFLAFHLVVSAITSGKFRPASSSVTASEVQNPENEDTSSEDPSVTSAEEGEDGTSSADAALSEESNPSASEASSEEESGSGAFTPADAAQLMTASPEEEAQGVTGFSYDRLSEDVQRLYRQLYTGVAAQKTSLFITACSTSDAGRALNALLDDHPEFFWMDGKASIYGLEGAPVVQIGFEFNIAPESIGEARALIEIAALEYESTIPEGAGTYDKVKAAYEYIIRKTDYDSDLTGAQSQNIQSVFIDRLSVCAGYARAFKYLLDRQGIPCAFLSGTANGPDGSPESHAWNLVTIDGVDTLVDVTWGDPTYLGEGDADPDFISYDYLCLTSEEMARTGHAAGEYYTHSDCTDRSYDYYLLNGSYYETFDYDKVAFALMDAVDNNRTEVRLKFGSDEAYQEAMYELFEGGMVADALQRRMSWDNLTSITYYHQYSEGLYTIRVFW